MGLPLDLSICSVRLPSAGVWSAMTSRKPSAQLRMAEVMVAYSAEEDA